MWYMLYACTCTCGSGHVHMCVYMCMLYTTNCWNVSTPAKPNVRASDLGWASEECSLHHRRRSQKVIDWKRRPSLQEMYAVIKYEWIESLSFVWETSHLSLTNTGIRAVFRDQKREVRRRIRNSVTCPLYNVQ